MKNKVNARFVCIMIGFIITISFLNEIWFQLNQTNIRIDQVLMEVELKSKRPLSGLEFNDRFLGLFRCQFLKK